MNRQASEKPAALCVHGRPDCPRCAAFTRSLIAAVDARDTAWRPGVLASLNRASARP